MSFRDLFTQGAAAYAAWRPRYPGALFDFLARQAPGRALAWDCATGNGQAALSLAVHFDRVIATDASAAQLAEATPHEHVEYRVALAEASGIAPGTVDLVTVAQALHWLDREAFFAEARRVLVPGGIVAVWCYALVTVEPRIDALLERFRTETVGDYWPPGRELVESGYRTIDFPFDELATPPLSIERRLSLNDLGAYLRTWSATRRCVEHTGRDPVPTLLAELRPLWGDPDEPRVVRWPLHARVGRFASSGSMDDRRRLEAS